MRIIARTYETFRRHIFYQTLSCTILWIVPSNAGLASRRQQRLPLQESHHLAVNKSEGPARGTRRLYCPECYNAMRAWNAPSITLELVLQVGATSMPCNNDKHGRIYKNVCDFVVPYDCSYYNGIWDARREIRYICIYIYIKLSH